MFNVLNSTEYPIILDGDENAVLNGRLNGLVANATRVFSENRFGEKVYVGMVTERTDDSVRMGTPRYAYTGYGFPETVETDSVTSINNVVVLCVRVWAESF